MLRVCGAEGERDNLSARRCWCGGLFCGKGGYRETRAFQRESRKRLTASTFAEFRELLRDVDLFDGVAISERWVDRITIRGAGGWGASSRRAPRPTSDHPSAAGTASGK